jgi:hypothetical protein
MKILRRSIDQLTGPPICKACNVEMDWSRSAHAADKQTILHIFICPGCGAIGETKTPVKKE